MPRHPVEVADSLRLLGDPPPVILLVFGLGSLLPYAVYLLAVYGLTTRLSLPMTLLAATACWALAAGLLLWGWQLWMH